MSCGSLGYTYLRWDELSSWVSGTNVHFDGIQNQLSVHLFESVPQLDPAGSSLASLSLCELLLRLFFPKLLRDASGHKHFLLVLQQYCTLKQ